MLVDQVIAKPLELRMALFLEGNDQIRSGLASSHVAFAFKDQLRVNSHAWLDVDQFGVYDHLLFAALRQVQPLEMDLLLAAVVELLDGALDC